MYYNAMLTSRVCNERDVLKHAVGVSNVCKLRIVLNIMSVFLACNKEPVVNRNVRVGSWQGAGQCWLETQFEYRSENTTSKAVSSFGIASSLA